MSERLYHVDGELVPADEATVSVRDRGFRCGDAAVETLRAYGGDVFEWDAHADRLRESCRTLALDHGRSDAELRARIDETLAANDLADASVRLSITRGAQSGRLTLDPDRAVDPTVVAVVEPLPRGGRESDPVWDGPATVQTVRTRRPTDDALPAGAKTHSRLNGLLARLELRRSAEAAAAGEGGETTPADEALALDADGRVAGGATNNLFFVADDALRTPSLDGPVFPGVTRSVVLELAREEGVPVAEGSYAPADVRGADEAFLTDTAAEIRPIGTVDGVDVGGGPVTSLLARLFDDRIEREHY